MRRDADVTVRKYLASPAVVGCPNPDPNIDLPISQRVAQIDFCFLFACAVRHDALEGTPKPLPMWNVSHSPPPPPPGRGSGRGASRTAVVKRLFACLTLIMPGCSNVKANF